MRRLQSLIMTLGILLGFNFILSGEALASDITINSNTVWEAGIYTYDNVLVTNGATLTFNGAVTLNANNLTLDSTSSISADGKGYPSGQGSGAGGGNGAGGGYGGKGRSHAGSLGGSTYGSAVAPVDMGSGGGATGWNGVPGGSGGGAIRINISETLTLNGLVSANGNEFSKDSYYAGGGSGGSVYIITKNLTGGGRITVNGGGKTSVNAGGGGGGGRVAVYYQTSTFAGNLEAKGGIGYGNGEDGTVVSIDTQSNILYSGHSFRFQENDSPFNFDKIILNNSQVTSEGSFSLTTGQLFLESSSFSSGGSSLLKVNMLSLENISALTLKDNANLIALNPSFLSHSSLSFTGTQSLSVPSLTLNNSALTLSGTETVNLKNLTLSNNSTLSSLAQGKINLNLVNLAVDSTSSISADGKGYPSGQGPGAGDIEAGAGYGGKGGNISAFIGGSTYGSAVAPVDMGSGGGILPWNGVPGGSGGGAIRINISETLTLNGLVSANGNEFSKDSYYAGGGSGGSVYIITKNLTGGGRITVNGGGKTSVNAGGGGGGGRVAVYYQASTFAGNLEAKGGVGWQNGEDGTIVFQPISLDTPLTTFNLTETSSTTATSQETLSTQQLTLNNIQVTGDLSGTLNFTNLTLTTLTSGAFSGKGFLEAEFETTLEGVSYQGNLQGVVYPDHKENKLHLKASISGLLINGIAEATLIESTPGSGVYDKYQATWKLNRLGTDIISATLNSEGAVSYQPSHSFTSGVYTYQGNFEGDALGSYSGPLSAVLTHLRLTSENEYQGKGFSIISYNSLLGQGEGYSYNQATSEGLIDFQGFFESPLLGKLQATLDETKNPKTLSGTIERLDLGFAPASDLKVMVLGPQRVSPGQTFDYIVELRNDGLKAAENVTVVDELPWQTTYISNTGSGAYEEYSREVVWDLKAVGAKSTQYFTTKGEVVWGLPESSSFENLVTIPKKRILVNPPEIDPEIEVSFDIQDVTENRLIMNTTIADSQLSGFVNIVIDIFDDVIQATEPQEEYTSYVQKGAKVLDFVVKYVVPKEENSRLWKRIQVAAKTTDKTLGLIQKARGFVQDVVVYNSFFNNWLRDQEDLNRLLKVNKIDYDFYEDFTDRNTIKLVGSFIPKLISIAINKIPEIEKVGRLKEYFTKPTRNLPNVFEFVYQQRLSRDLANQEAFVALKEWRAENSYAFASHPHVVTTARDPNEILVSPEGDVRPGDKLNYTINYENEGEGDAYGVYITDTLEEDLDDTTLVVSDGGQYDPETRTITWFIGELLSKQKGAVTFSVNVKQDAQDKQEVINFATVYFPSVPEITRTNGTVNGITTYIDNVAPVTTASVSPLPNSAGWNNSDVTVTLSAADNEGGSGVAKTEYSLDNTNWIIYVSPFTITAEGTTTVYYKSTDNLNNAESTKTIEIKLDKTLPIITFLTVPQPNSFGWNNTDVAVSFTATDNLSGVASVSDAVTVITEGASQNIGGEAFDIAGNRASADVTINIDKTPPAITVAFSPQANSVGWNNTDVTVTFTGEDALSGIQTIAQPVVVTTEGAGQLIAGEAVDFADNKASTSLTLNIDKTPPEILLDLKSINLSEKDEKEDKGNWYEFIYSARDNLSGLKDLQAGLTVISLAGFKQELEADEELEIEIDEKKKELEIEGANPQSILDDLKDSLLNLNTNQILQLKVKQGDRKWKLKEKDQGIEIQTPSCIFKAIASDIAGNQAAKELEFSKDREREEDD